MPKSNEKRDGNRNGISSVVAGKRKTAIHGKVRGIFHLTDMKGTVGEARLDYIIRDHDPNQMIRKNRSWRTFNTSYAENTTIQT